MSKGDIAKQNFMNGYNCSQAVLLAFCEDFGLEKETALKISEPFGRRYGQNERSLRYCYRYVYGDRSCNG